VNFTLRELWERLSTLGGGVVEHSRFWGHLFEECPWVLACLTFTPLDPRIQLSNGAQGWYNLEASNYTKFIAMARGSGLYEEREVEELERLFAEQGILNST